LANGSHGHFWTRQKKLNAAQRMVWYYAKKRVLATVKGKAKLTIVLVFPQKRRRDQDGLVRRVKGLLDGLVKGGWLRGRRYRHLELVVRAEVRPGQKATELTLEACESDGD
jgi:Holliday junction resolvase RusA-like endonuclease